MSLRTIFAQNLRLIRLERGYSQETLADAAHLDRTYISLLEREQYSASLDAIERIAKALDVAPAVLLEPSADRNLPLATSD